MTGFQLKFPDSSYGKILYALGFNEGIRQWVHRISALIMIGLSIYHTIYLLFNKRGRDVLFGIFPKFSDIIQFKETMLYYMHLSKKHPQYENYNYMEKMEYWALIWGTLVMGFTGLVLWFPTVVGNWAPIWFIKVSETVHFYEAILATLAILIWHWFFVIFHPKEYPVSFTVFNGQMSVNHYKGEHRLQYHRIILEYLEVKSGKLEAKKMNHYTKMFIKAIIANGITMDEFVANEMEKDAELKAFIEANK
jgi:cytochrome b subunit of formate dehydrogenase